MEERRSPKPEVAGSTPATPAIYAPGPRSSSSRDAVTETAILKMLKDFNLAEERLATEQLAEVIRQLLASGDLMRNVVAPPVSFGIGAIAEVPVRSSVTYLPGRGNVELRARVALLEDALSGLLEAVEESQIIHQQRNVSDEVIRSCREVLAERS